MVNGAYHYLDLVPKGRDEREVGHKMEWVRHHDRYEPESPAAAAATGGACCSAHAAEVRQA